MLVNKRICSILRGMIGERTVLVLDTMSLSHPWRRDFLGTLDVRTRCAFARVQVVGGCLYEVEKVLQFQSGRSRRTSTSLYRPFSRLTKVCVEFRSRLDDSSECLISALNWRLTWLLASLLRPASIAEKCKALHIKYEMLLSFACCSRAYWSDPGPAACPALTLGIRHSLELFLVLLMDDGTCRIMATNRSTSLPDLKKIQDSIKQAFFQTLDHTHFPGKPLSASDIPRWLQVG